MTIDELLEKHPAPWVKNLDGFYDADRDNIWMHEMPLDIDDIVNAYAALKAENAALMECVKAADDIRLEDCDVTRLHYDAVRAKVKP